MSEIAKLNVAQTELAITKIENNLVSNIAKNNEIITDNMAKNNEVINEINVKLNDNNEKLDGFQNLVVTLNETVRTVEIQAL